MIIEKYCHAYRCFLTTFDCGNSVINGYVHNKLGTDLDGSIPYFLLSEDRSIFMGFYSIEAGRLDQSYDGKHFTPMGGTVNISYLALDKKYQHKWLGQTAEGTNFYIGDYLLNDCERRILALSKNVGISFITLYSSKEGYHMYHDRNGYEDFDGDMITVVQDSDVGSKKLYKWVSDISDPFGQ